MPLALSHLNIPAKDPEALRRWYVETLGFEAHGPKGGFLWSGGTLLNIVPGEPLAGDWHFGFRVGSKRTLARWAARLGATVEDHGAYATFYTKDPEGNPIEFFVEAPPPAKARRRAP